MNWFGGILKVYVGTPGMESKPVQRWDGVSFQKAQEIVNQHGHILNSVWMYEPYSMQMEKEG